MAGSLTRFARSVRQWFDGSAGPRDGDAESEGVDWPRLIPFIGMHLACFSALWTGVSPIAVAIAAGLYVVRMFAITGGYHRYFSHRSFRTSRPVQFAFAVLGASSVQRGPLWWAAHHRVHHKHSDERGDAHSPRLDGFVRSHVGWFCDRKNFSRPDTVSDLARFPELRVLDRFDILVPLALAGMLFGLGATLATLRPELGTSGPQMLVWGFCISTVVLYHATFTINSIAHRVGHRDYDTADDSRNNAALALITLGEGWHNNHHRYPHSVRQGFRWWQIDLTYYGLALLAKLGVIWDLRPVPARVIEEARHRKASAAR